MKMFSLSSNVTDLILSALFQNPLYFAIRALVFTSIKKCFFHQVLKCSVSDAGKKYLKPEKKKEKQDKKQYFISNLPVNKHMERNRMC